MTPITLRPVENSSQVEAAGYDAETQTFAVKFKRTPAVYRYQKVPQEVAMAFDEAPSKGVFIATEVKGRYEFVKVDAEPAQA